MVRPFGKEDKMTDNQLAIIKALMKEENDKSYVYYERAKEAFASGNVQRRELYEQWAARSRNRFEGMKDLLLFIGYDVRVDEEYDIQICSYGE